MATSDIINDLVGSVFVFCLINFPMKMLIKSELRINPQQEDNLAFRLRATKPVSIVLGLFIAAIYSVPVLGYFLIPNSSSFLHDALLQINPRILILLAVALPVILDNLLNFKRVSQP